MARQILYIFLVLFVATAFALEVSTFRSNDFPVSVCSVKSFIERDFVSPQNGVLTLAEDSTFKVSAKIENSEVTAVAFEFNGAKVIYQNGLVKESNNLVYKNLISKKKIQVRKYLSNSIVEFVTNNSIVKVSGNLRVISSISISVPSSAAFGITGACKALDRIKTVLASEATFPNAPSIKVPIYIMNDDASTFKIPTQRISSKTKAAAVDVVVVGGGLAGLTAASFISDFQDLKVIVLEKESFLGGLAAGTHNEKGKSYSRGAAYFTKPFKSERLIMNHMGIVPHDPQAIEEPIDSYYNPQSTKPTPSEALKGYYRGIWEAEELARLHVSFRIFALEMRSKHMDRLIANQPIERLYTRPEDYDKLLDTVTAKEWVSSLPCDMKERKVPGIEPLLKELEEKEGHYDCKNKYADHRMAPIFELLNLYSRSALGVHTEKINAEAFVNFYWAELQPRYTTPIGTQYAINTIVKRLESRPTVQLKTDSLVVSVERDSYKDKKSGKKEEYAIVKYVQTNEQGQAVEYTIEADYVIYASQLGFAPQIIKNFAKDRPEQAKLMSDLEHMHYLVNEVTVEGHPWRSTYDLWVHNKDYTQNDPSDIINGRWTEFGGYKKYQDFKLDPPGDGIITVYHPMTYEMAKKPLNYEEAVQWAKYSVMRGLSSLQPLATATNPLKNSKSNIKVKSITASRWPYSIHWNKVGHFKNALTMKKHYGVIYFGSSSLGTPAYEEALFRGYESAMGVLVDMDKLVEGLFEKYLYSDDD